MTTTPATLAPSSRDEHYELAAAEWERLLELLDTLDPEDWARPTECPDWDVREMTAHLLGAAEGNASIREFVRTTLKARKGDPDLPFLDRLNAAQVADRDHLGPVELMERLRAVVPASIRGRRRFPFFLRRAKTEAPGVDEKFTMGHLMDVVYTRDVWMHRIDIARATGRDLVLTPDHDGRLVAGVVDEWARTHGEPVDILLTGPAGHRFTIGEGGERIEMDAVEFCRSLAGRAPAEGLMTTFVAF